MIALLAACSEWPRFDHVARPDTGGEPPGGQTASPSPIEAWVDLDSPIDPADDSPVGLVPTSIAVLLGVGQLGELRGAGWAPGIEAERPDCGGIPSGFPTESVGDYLGDLDWRVVDLAAAGVLCSRLVPEVAAARIDVMAFEVDGCGLPTTPLYTRGGDVVGFAPANAENQWGATVLAGRVALVAAAWEPDDLDLVVPYAWDLALLPDTSAPDGCAEVVR